MIDHEQTHVEFPVIRNMISFDMLSALGDRGYRPLVNCLAMQKSGAVYKVDYHIPLYTEHETDEKPGMWEYVDSGRRSLEWPADDDGCLLLLSISAWDKDEKVVLWTPWGNTDRPEFQKQMGMMVDSLEYDDRPDCWLSNMGFMWPQAA